MIDLWRLLSPRDVHQFGDEMWTGRAWEPVPDLYFGDAVGEDSAPCRRPAFAEELSLRPTRRKTRTGTRFPGIVAAATALGVNRSTLFRALRGDVPLPTLRRRYQQLLKDRSRAS